MLIVLLRFLTSKANAIQFMDGHNSWLNDGCAKGAFLLAGTIQPKLGGAILTRNATLEQIQAMVNKDSFVYEGVVTAEIIEITPSKAAPQMGLFLCNSKCRRRS
jgi:uncharacterized protein YciI